jgi:hypothetical protein
LAKLFDNSLHKNFFCQSCKKNKNQMPLLFKISHESIIVSLIGVTLFSLSYGYMKDVDFYYQGIGSLASILSTWGIKNIFKGLWQHESGLRPYDEKHAPYKRSYGGCPSGHIAFAGAMTAYWFRERGPAWGLPFLALGVIGVGGVVSSNRHYVSQTIVGFTLGAIIGISMSKGVDFLRSVCDDIKYGFTYDSSNPTFYCQYTY